MIRLRNIALPWLEEATTGVYWKQFGAILKTFDLKGSFEII